MVIKSELELSKLIRSCDDKQAVELIKAYGNQRYESAVEDAWCRFRGVIKFINGRKQRRYNNFILTKDDHNGFISEVGFNKFWHKVYNEIDRINQGCSEETREALEIIEDVFTNALGDINLDRRIAFRNED